MSIFYEFMSDVCSDYNPEPVDKGLNGVFKRGVMFSGTLPECVEFTTDNTATIPPLGFYEYGTPIMSDELIAALAQAGVTNLQCFPAVVRSEIDGTVWENYKVVNVVGLVACADTAGSDATHIIDRPGDAPAFMTFENLKIDPVRAGDALIFRLAENPMTLVAAESVVEYLRSIQGDQDWGLTLRALTGEVIDEDDESNW